MRRSDAKMSARIGMRVVDALEPYTIHGILTAFHFLTNPAVAKAKKGTWKSNSNHIIPTNHGAVGFDMK